jgi:hypothetical protein
MTRTFLTLILIGWTAPAWAQTPDPWAPTYQTYIAPADPATGKLIPKGEVESTDVREICAGKGLYRNAPHPGGTYSQTHRLSQNEAVKRQVMANSGVPFKDKAHFEDDHFAPLCLGGSDSINNRWAQPRFGVWNAAVKDHLEGTACEMVCNGEVELPVAQNWFNTRMTYDWRVPYCTVFKDDPDCAEIFALYPGVAGAVLPRPR